MASGPSGSCDLFQRLGYNQYVSFVPTLLRVGRPFYGLFVQYLLNWLHIVLSASIYRTYCQDLRLLLFIDSFLVVLAFMMFSLCSKYGQALLVQGSCVGIGRGSPHHVRLWYH